MTALVDYLRRVHACADAVAWVGDRTLARAWRECERGDWMLWLAHAAGVDRRMIVIAAADCAALAIPYAGDAAATCEGVIAECYAWAHGERTDEEIAAASASAFDSAYAYASASSSDYSASAPASAYAAAYAAASAFAFDSAYAYAAAEWHARRADGLRCSADAVRAAIPMSAIRAAIGVRS